MLAGRFAKTRFPKREIEQILAKVKAVRPDFHWKHNALRHAYGSYRTALTRTFRRWRWRWGYSVGMVKNVDYLEAKTFEEGLRWFQIPWPVPAKKRASDPFLRWVAARS